MTRPPTYHVPPDTEVPWMGAVSDPAVGAAVLCAACRRPDLDAVTDGLGRALFVCRTCGRIEPVRPRSAEDADAEDAAIAAHRVALITVPRSPRPTSLAKEARHRQRQSEWAESVPHAWTPTDAIADVWGVERSTARYRLRVLHDAGVVGLRWDAVFVRGVRAGRRLMARREVW